MDINTNQIISDLKNRINLLTGFLKNPQFHSTGNLRNYRKYRARLNKKLKYWLTYAKTK